MSPREKNQCEWRQSLLSLLTRAPLSWPNHLRTYLIIPSHWIKISTSTFFQEGIQTFRTYQWEWERLNEILKILVKVLMAWQFWEEGVVIQQSLLTQWFYILSYGNKDAKLQAPIYLFRKYLNSYKHTPVTHIKRKQSKSLIKDIGSICIISTYDVVEKQNDTEKCSH